MNGATKWAAAATGGLFAVAILPLLLIFAVFSSNNCTTPPTSGPVNVNAPSGNVASEGDMVRYLESAGLSSSAAAGIVGNLEQESGLNPMAAGYGLAQWSASWWSPASAWIRSHGQNPDTSAGQLMYIAASAKDPGSAGFGYVYSGIWRDLQKAATPEDAAMYWQNDYEKCDGVTAADAGTANAVNGLCNSANRKRYAAQALAAAGGGTGTTVPVSSGQSGGLCVCPQSPEGSASGGKYVYPIPGFTRSRTDMGLDANAPTGMPVLAIGDSKLVYVIQGWYAGQPLLDFQFLDGPMQGKYWYVAEQIAPVSETIGTTFTAGRAVAHFAAFGSGIEIGFAGNATGQTLAQTTTGYTEGQVTQAGKEFVTFIDSLPHAPPAAGSGTSPAQGQDCTSGGGGGKLAAAAALALKAVQLESSQHVYDYTQGLGRTNHGAPPLQPAPGSSRITFDCSGFTEAVYKAAGLPDPSGNSGYTGTVEAPGSDGALMDPAVLHQVSDQAAVPGDIVLFHNHVTIYVGGGKVVSMGGEGDPIEATVAAEAAGHDGWHGMYHLQGTS